MQLLKHKLISTKKCFEDNRKVQIEYQKESTQGSANPFSLKQKLQFYDILKKGSNSGLTSMDVQMPHLQESKYKC